MNRADLQRLATTRLREAKILFEAELYSGAYYLSGYAIEFAFKACFARRVQRYDFSDRGSTGKVFTHKLSELVKAAHLEKELLEARQSNIMFRASWDVVLEWNEESRYAAWSKDDADALLHAIVGRRTECFHGSNDTGRSRCQRWIGGPRRS